MKKVSKSIPGSLRGQKPGGRKGLMPEVQTVKTGGPSMTVPGNGMVGTPPGADMDDRSVARYADPLGKRIR